MCSLNVGNPDAHRTSSHPPECSNLPEPQILPELHKYRSAHTKQLLMGHLNINSIRNKFHEMYDILSNELIDIFGLTETKLDASFASAQFSIPDYCLYRADRNANGGGIMVYVKSAIPHRIRHDIKGECSNGTELLVIEVKMKNEKMFIIIMYKPPSVSNEDMIAKLGSVLEQCYVEGNCVHILGDVNVNFNDLPNNMSNFLNEYSLINLIKDPTCHKNVANPTLIDVILTNSPNRIASHVNLVNAISDFHNLICAATKMFVPTCGKRKIVYRSFKNFNEQRFSEDLMNVPFHICDMFDDVDDTVWSYQYLLNEVTNVHAPIKTKLLKKPQLPYMNGELRKAINVKGMLKRKFLKCKNKQNWQRYRGQRNLVTSLKRKSIKEYFNKRCNNDTNNKQFWHTVRPFLSKNQKNDTNISLLEQGKIVSKPLDVCTTLNDYFVNLATELSEPKEVSELPIPAVIEFYKNHPSILNIRTQSFNSQPFYFSSVTQNQVLKSIHKLKEGKASGHDHIPAKLLKCSSPILSQSLTNIINRCINDSTFPDCYKHAEISPIYKKSDCLRKENYRPVSVLTAFSKILENILSDQLLTYFDDILCKMVSAYRKMYSTNNVLIKCVEEWKLAIDKRYAVGCVAMDLSKAFDSIPHKLLIAKLNAYGVSMEACGFMNSYLSSRKQRVKMNGFCSEWLDIQRGVPQGSILGPLLFNIYLNDFVMLIQNYCQIVNYADDNTLSFNHKDVNVVKSNLEIACITAVQWFNQNYMKVNAEKFQYIMFHNGDDDISLNLNETVIHSSKELKLLGITLDNELCFNKHIEKLQVQASRQINVLYRLSRVLTLPCKIKIMDAFIMSNFNYCSIVYHHCNVGDAKKLEKLMKRALRFVYLNFDCTYNELLSQANRSSLYVSRLRVMLLTVYKIINGLCPPLPIDFFPVHNVPYDLRRSNLLVQSQYNTIRHGFNSLRYKGAMLWNQIPDNVKISSFNEFKNFVMKWQPHCMCGSCLMCTM